MLAAQLVLLISHIMWCDIRNPPPRSSSSSSSYHITSSQTAHNNSFAHPLCVSAVLSRTTMLFTAPHNGEDLEREAIILGSQREEIQYLWIMAFKHRTRWEEEANEGKESSQQYCHWKRCYAVEMHFTSGFNGFSHKMVHFDCCYVTNTTQQP